MILFLFYYDRILYLLILLCNMLFLQLRVSLFWIILHLLLISLWYAFIYVTISELRLIFLMFFLYHSFLSFLFSALWFVMWFFCCCCFVFLTYFEFVLLLCSDMLLVPLIVQKFWLFTWCIFSSFYGCYIC